MSTQVCVLNQTTKLIDFVIGAANGGPGFPGTPVVLNENGLLDPTFLNIGVTAVAGQNLFPGNLVNLHNVSGVLTATLATAESSASPLISPAPADGFVLDTVASGLTVSVYTSGTFPFANGGSPPGEITSSNIGQVVYLSADDIYNAGGVTLTAPSSPNLVQAVGYVAAYNSNTNVVTIAFLPAVDDFAHISGICQLNQGGTGADLSATGGSHYFVRQNSVGAAFTVSAIVEADLPATTVFTDIANTYGQHLQKFQAETYFDLVDPTDNTKVLQFSVSTIATGTTRTLSVPNANSNTIQPLGSATSHQWIQYIDNLGVQHLSQPSTSDLSDWTDTGISQSPPVGNGYVPLWNTSTGQWTPTQLTFEDLVGAVEFVENNSPPVAVTTGATPLSPPGGPVNPSLIVGYVQWGDYWLPLFQ